MVSRDIPGGGSTASIPYLRAHGCIPRRACVRLGFPSNEALQGTWEWPHVSAGDVKAFCLPELLQEDAFWGGRRWVVIVMRGELLVGNAA